MTTTPTTPQDAAREKLAKGMTGLLADTYTLYNSTQVCHWNVEGSNFKELHDLFEEQYTGLAEAVDTIAERIRAMNFYTPGTLADIARQTRVEQPESFRDTAAMLRHLIEAHRVAAHRIRATLELAEHQPDEATADVLVERLRSHEKTTWMLESHLDDGSRRLTRLQPEREAVGATS